MFDDGILIQSVSPGNTFGRAFRIAGKSQSFWSFEVDTCSHLLLFVGMDTFDQGFFGIQCLLLCAGHDN